MTSNRTCGIHDLMMDSGVHLQLNINSGATFTCICVLIMKGSTHAVVVLSFGYQ